MEEESRGLGASEPERERFGRSDVGPLIVESVKLTLGCALHWMIPLLLMVLVGVLGYAMMALTPISAQVLCYQRILEDEG